MDISSQPERDGNQQNFSSDQNTPNSEPINIDDHDQKLANLIDISNTPLLKIESVFPFHLVPDELSIDPTKITFTYKHLFGGKEQLSVAIQDITEVEVTNNLFFAQLRLMTNLSEEQNRDYTINFLQKEEARKARQIIQGLEVAVKQGIDLTMVKNTELLHRIEELGSV